MDLRHEEEIHSPSSATYKAEDDSPTVDVGIDLSEFYMSVEWDILEVVESNPSLEEMSLPNVFTEDIT